MMYHKLLIQAPADGRESGKAISLLSRSSRR